MKYELHPACAAWPPLPEDEIAALAEDIRINGLREPITLTPDRKLLDGRNRALACDRIDVDPAIVIHQGDPVAFSLSKNLHRRHMSKVDLAFAGARLAKLGRGAPKGSRNAAKLKRSNERFNSQDKSQTDIADNLGIPEVALRRAKRILDSAVPELEDIVKNKTDGVTLFGASEYVRQTPRSQQTANLGALKTASRKTIAPAKPSTPAPKPKELEIDRASLSMSAQQRLAALENRLEKQFEDRVQREVQRLVKEDVLPYYKEKLAKADQLSKYGKPFTNSEYRTILAALHPDSSKERRAEAFTLVKSKEVLLRPEEKDKPYTSDLPTNLMDLLARRRSKRA